MARIQAISAKAYTLIQFDANRMWVDAPGSGGQNWCRERGNRNRRMCLGRRKVAEHDQSVDGRRDAGGEAAVGDAGVRMPLGRGAGAVRITYRIFITLYFYHTCCSRIVCITVRTGQPKSTNKISRHLNFLSVKFFQIRIQKIEKKQ